MPLQRSSSNATLSSNLEAVRGLCTVQLELKPGRTSAIASTFDVSQAAVAVLGKCVARLGRNTGGIAIDIGEYVNKRSDRYSIIKSKTYSHRCYQAETTTWA